MSSNGDDVDKLRNRFSRLEDKFEHVVKPRLDAQQEAIEARDDRIAALEAEVEATQSRLNSIIDVEDSSESSPELRAVALREAMIRAARDRSGSGGVTWWWREVKDQLASHGHGGFSKPVYHTAIDDAAEKGGFTAVRKEVVSGGQVREVKAIQLNPAKVTEAHLRNQLTTRVGVAGQSGTAKTDGGMTQND